MVNINRTIQFLVLVLIVGPCSYHTVTGYSGSNTDIRNHEKDRISLNTLSHLCYAQCLAKCLDGQRASGIPLNRPVCENICSHYKHSLEWIETCGNNTECLERCSYLRNNTDGGQVLQEIPVPSLQQLNSKWIGLNWKATNSTVESTIYVVESAHPAEKWEFLSQTNKTTVASEIAVCAKRAYRVASVNQYGSKGFNSSLTVTRYDLPRPPGVQFIIPHIIIFDKEQSYFYVTMYWNPPIGWAGSDIQRYKIFDEMRKVCSPDNIMPAVPFVSSIREIPEAAPIVEANIEIHRFGRGCIYFTTVRAVSQCGIFGEPVEVTIDLTDCHNVIGMDCGAPKPMPPGRVTNATVELLNHSLCVSVEWHPPEDMGTAGKVDNYDVQWGTHPENAVTSVLIEAGRKVIPSNDTAIEICVNRTNVTYGVKVVPRVRGIQGRTFDIDIWQRDAEFCIDDMKEYGGDRPVTENPQEGPNGGKLENVGAETVVACVALASIVLLSSVIFIKKRGLLRKRKRPEKLALHKIDPAHGREIQHLVTNPFYISSDPWEIPRERLVLGAALGKGAFGQVVLGELSYPRPPSPPPPPPNVNQGINIIADSATEYVTPNSDTVLKVAVKMLHDSADGAIVADFLQEIVLMKSIGAHPHIVSMLGCCTLKEPLCLIVEHMPGGDLLHYLRKRRRILTDASLEPEDKLSVKDLLSFARQVTIGMEFLSQRGYVHRDLATRNILVGSERNVKIGDFGLTRYIYDDHVYVMQRGRTLPLKWMAIEAIFDLVFNTQTDVWSFGVVLYELITLGGVPYPTIPNRALLKRLQSGYRQDEPDNCPPQL